MKQYLLLFNFLGLAFLTTAQTTILDFEDPTTSTTYQYFGSTLEPGLNNILANPDPTGINTSAMVADHIKPAGAQVWAGAFANPALQTAADFTTDNQICIKVWFNEPGNVGVKLEASSNGGANWIRTLDVNDSQQWVELCFDVALPSLEDPFQPAAGFSYDGVTLFFDFGDSPTSDRTYYWDDLITQTGVGVMDGDVTFSVDMNNYADPFTTVFVSGTFNGWSGDGNPLDDSDGDGVWTGTVTNIPVGAHEFKFTLDNWAGQEAFSPYTPCVVVDPTGQFVNRRLDVSGDVTLPTHCFNSCFACGDAVNITFEVGQGSTIPDPNGFYVAGGGNFGNPGDFPLDDSDGDGIWTITVERQKGFSSFFTFTNGACPDYSCKEDIAGQDCANPGNFNDRFLETVTQDTTVSTCFQDCSIDANDCAGGVVPANVTFKVSMNDYTDPFTTPYVSGSFNGWAGDSNPMSDADGDGIWEASLVVNPGDYEFKFTIDNWAADEQFTGGEPCTITDPSGQFVNRFLSVSTDTTICFEFGTCTACQTTGVKDLVFDASLFSLSPNVVNDFTILNFAKKVSGTKNVKVFNSTGTLLWETEVDAATTSATVSTDNFSAGLYLVFVQVGDTVATKKFVKN